MSGHCDLCGVWHSGSCCHPGRAQLENLRRQLAEAEESIAMQKSQVTYWFNALSAAEAKLALAEQLLLDIGIEAIQWQDGQSAIDSCNKIAFMVSGENSQVLAAIADGEGK